MGDLFDFNGDGKVDCFEGAMGWDMLDHATNSKSDSAPNTYHSCHTDRARKKGAWKGVVKCVSLIILGYALLLYVSRFL